MPEQTFIYLRYPDGREQRLVAGAAGERVAAREASRGATRFEPEAAYTVEDAQKAATERTKARANRAAKPAKAAEKPAEAQGS